MILYNDIKTTIQAELTRAKSVWIASAMISNNGWSFIQKHLPASATQNYVIGIDLSTDPRVLESIFKNTKINARIYEMQFTFHPKVYLIQRLDSSFTCFIGSSNTTTWGLEKNIEMNYQINDRDECIKVLAWFNGLHSKGYIVTESFIKKI